MSMNQHTITPIVLRDYLLGDLPEQDAEQIEELYFCSEEVFEQLSCAEDALINDYVGGRLSLSQKERFERYFLITEERKQLVQLTQLLHFYQQQEHPPMAAQPELLEQRKSLFSEIRALLRLLSNRLMLPSLRA